MKFRDAQEIIDSRLLTSLVQKHNVEYVTKPLERRQLWLALTKEYNGQRGTTVNHARLSKRWHNMKQRARAQIASIKRSAIKQHQQRSGRLGQVKAYIAGEGEEGGGEATIELIKGERDADEMEGVGAQDELLNDIRNNKAKQDELLRDLLICLVRKYRVEEAKRSPAAKLRMWNDLSREYHRLSGGILNANAKQLQNKWHNIKFNAKGKGRPNPYTDPNWDKDQDVISEQLQPYKELLEDENVEREIEAHLQQDYLFASAMHGHKMSIVRPGTLTTDGSGVLDQKRDRNLPPSNESSRKKKRAEYDIDLEHPPPTGLSRGVGGVTFSAGGDVHISGSDYLDLPDPITMGGDSQGSSVGGGNDQHSRQLRTIERQIYVETLRFEQEKLRLFRENAELERQKLLKDVEASEIQLQLARAELDRAGQQ